MEEEIIIQLVKTLSKIKESNETTHKQILREVVKTNKTYTEILEQLRIQNQLLEDAAKEGKVIEI